MVDVHITGSNSPIGEAQFNQLKAVTSFGGTLSICISYTVFVLWHLALTDAQHFADTQFSEAGAGLQVLPPGEYSAGHSRSSLGV